MWRGRGVVGRERREWVKCGEERRKRAGVKGRNVEEEAVGAR